jgi:hypothetical protein
MEKHFIDPERSEILLLESIKCFLSSFNTFKDTLGGSLMELVS